jgi:hypothetical protein
VRGGVQLGPLGTAATDWHVVHAPGDYDDGEFGGMKIGRGNRSTRRKRAPAPLCPPQTSLDQTRDRTRAAAMGSQRLTAWAMARPYNPICTIIQCFSFLIPTIDLLADTQEWYEIYLSLLPICVVSHGNTCDAQVIPVLCGYDLFESSFPTFVLFLQEQNCIRNLC